MALKRDLYARKERGVAGTPLTSAGASFGVPVALIIAAALLAWIFYGTLSPTVDNTGTTTPVPQTDLPQATPKPQPPAAP